MTTATVITTDVSEDGPGGDSDVALLRAVKSGDSAAFDRLFHRYYPRLRRFLWRFCSEDLVDEVICDTMYTVWDKAGGFQGRSQVSTWIFGIAYRRAMKLGARARRHAELPEQVRAQDVPVDEGENGHAQHELSQWVEQALDQLPGKQRAVVELTFFADLSYPEIAAIVDCPVGTVKTRMHKAKRTLKPILQNLSDALRGRG